MKKTKSKKQDNVNKRRVELMQPRPPIQVDTKWKLAVTFLLTVIVILSVALSNKYPTPQDFGQKNTLGELFCGKDGKLYAKVFSQDTSTSPRGYHVEPIKKNNRKQYVCTNKIVK